MTTQAYTAPLDRLLTLGSIEGSSAWPDYLGFGIGPDHIPELIRMATDPDLNEAATESPEVWAPVHAWRTLARLHAGEAAAPLAELFRRIDENDDDYVGEDLPKAFGRLGPGAIPALMAYLADENHGLWARVAAAHSLSYIALNHSAAREQCLAILAGQLGLFARQDPALNGSLVAYLLDLDAVEAADAIEQAYRAGEVDEAIVGDWQKVQRELGLTSGAEQTPLALRAAADRAKHTGPQPRTSAPLAAEARLAQALREADLKLDLGPKRKHHRKRK